MAISISYNVRGQKEVEKKLNLIKEDVKNPKEMLKEAIEMWKETTEGEVFSSQGSSHGRRWASLSPGYAAIKARRYPGKGILVASGKMRDSFKTTVSSTKAVLSNTDKKFAWHQLGTRKMPAREMLVLDNKRIRKTEEIFNKHIKKTLNK